MVVLLLTIVRSAPAPPACKACQAGTFCFNDTLHSCPRDSTSRVSADNVTACVCAAGFRQVSSSNHSCVLCEAGTYCVAERQRPCPVRSDSGPGSASLAACVCDAGYAGAPADAVQCVACAHAQYEINNECRDCSADSDSESASSAATDCTCNAGYTGGDGQACSACARGKFKSGRGSAACASCAQNSDVREAASVSAAACDCNAGFARRGGACARCAFGTYKKALGDGACDDCPTHSNTTDTGSTALAACLCLPGFGLDVGKCTRCSPGHASSGGAAACHACASGSHAPGAGHSTCVPCGADSWQDAEGQSECVPCPAQARSLAGSKAQTACLCNPGFSGQKACTACAAGTFKTGTGPAACARCDTGTTTTATAAAAAAACTACPAGTYGLSGADDAAVCAACAENTTLVRGSGEPGQCLCSPGYGGDDCAACSAGSNKTQLGPGACVRCPPGHVSGEAAAACAACAANTFETARAECRPCPAHSHAPPGTHATCPCDAGYPLLDGACTACTPGHYEAAGLCVQCPADTFGVDTAAVSPAVCVACPPNSTSAAGANHSLACRCVPGYTGESSCRQCAEGTYKTVAGTALCVECAAGTHWPQDKTERSKQLCRACPGNSTSGAAAHGVYNCHCSAGFKRVDDKCEQCLRGQHCAGGVHAMRTCPLRSSSAAGSASIAACVCEPGYHGANGTCAVCPVNMYCEGGRVAAACPLHATTLTRAGSSRRAACVCAGGYYEFAGVCVLCPLGSYCHQDERFRCRANASSIRGSGNKTDCHCDAGFVSEAGVCAACGSGDLCSGATTNFNAVHLTVELQPPGQASARRLRSQDWFDETVLSTVVARALNLTVDDVTVLATKWTGASVEVDLVVATASVALAEDLAAMLSAPPPHSEGAPAAPALPLLARVLSATFSVSAASAAVLTAKDPHALLDAAPQGPDNETAPVMSTAYILSRVPGLTATVSVAAPVACAVQATVRGGVCTCAPGAFCEKPEARGCLQASECSACAAGSYCSHNAATRCPENETAPAESGLATACRCLSAHYRDNHSDCKFCPQHSYCADEKRHECPLFDPDLVTDGPGRTTRTACHCRPGFFRLTHDDKCRPCPLNYYCPSEYEVYACMQYGYTETTASESKSQCFCHGGFQWGESDDSCLPCENHVCGGGEVTDFCDASRVPDREHTACVCRPGLYPLNHRECQPCQAGHVRADRGDGPCTPCPTGTFSANTTHCLPCAADMNTTGSGHAHCRCDAPLMFVGGRCEPCPVDTYFEAFDASNRTRIASLVVHSWNAATATVGTVTRQWHRGLCKRCPASASTLGMRGLTAPAVCRCDRGFRFLPARGECKACPANTFEADSICFPCGIDAVSPNSSLSEAACVCPEVPCAHGVQRPPKLFGRHCLLKCDPVLDVCTACAAGTAKPNVSAVGNNDACERCAFSEFQEAAASTACDACTPTRAHLLAGATNRSACLCAPGHAPDPAAPARNAPCLPCAPGHYKPSLSNAQCQQCDFGSFMPGAGATACLSCALFAPVANASTTAFQASRSDADCTCHPGHERRGAACVACPAGSFRTTKGTEACAQCGAALLPHHYGHAAVSTALFKHCVTCPVHAGQDNASVSRATPMLEEAHCLCFPHFEHNGSACAACPEFHVKLAYGPGPCALCPAGYFVTLDGLQCDRCHLDTQNPQQDELREHFGMAVNEGNATLLWGETQDDCVCSLGYERQGAHCHACPLGQFRGTRLPTECGLCAAGTYSDTAASEACTACPAHAYTNSTGSVSLQDCGCEAGYEWHGEGCQACAAGSIRPTMQFHSQCESCVTGYYQDSTAQTQCRQCGAHEWSEAPFSGLGSCRCDAGFGSDAAGACAACAHGRYSAGGSANAQRPACASCPANKNTSATHQTSIAACECVPGHGVPAASPEDQECEACPTGYYAAGGSSTPCVHCGFGGITDPPVAARTFEACRCNAAAGLLSAA